MITKLFGFNGGVKPATHKDDSARAPIIRAPLPARLIVPLRHNTRAIARPIVEIGQHVLKGERIGGAEGVLGTACHAPTSGTVVDIAEHTMPHPSGLPTLCVYIEPDGEDRWIERKPFDYANCGCGDRQAVLDYLRDSGIVGMGGAAFPSHIKVGTKRVAHTLVLNGAECEPWITSDDRLMRERADSILRGAEILSDLLGAQRILVGIEDNKPEAIAAMREAAQKLPVAEVIVVPTLYPAGGEKQLIRVLTGIEIPHGKLGTEFGVQCFNVGTAEAVHRAFDLGEPLLSRVVTLTGNVERPGNWEVLVGTPIENLLELVGPRADTDRYILGGPMMGFALPDLSVPVVKGTNCVIAASQALFPYPPPEQPCIRCGACAEACPADLQPFELYWYARSKNFGKAQEYHLFDCIECGCCAYVCPSNIPLVDYYRFAKSEIWAREREHDAADAARERFEFRNYRQEREKAEKAARLAAKAAETKAKLAARGEGETAKAEDDPKKALIAAALARAKAQKESVAPKNTDDLPPEVQAEIAEIDARRKPLTGEEVAAQEAAEPSAREAGEAAAHARDEDTKKALITAAIERAKEQKAKQAERRETAERDDK
ncbi:electron transport complex subunit RsxC [Pseudazoarcus pumilus]|uniref:Ion-translocating oxidoreductase complex subunit C n=1 Tax=Pseudazoarcus pumilus TaxID=2067960 RepID=A0A2I6S6R3_9RHOO|nr:electron transport complex subunit RsxC [Pseudazoarcus pumilus]AUN94943.1 electron transport complex subunit RsxC [Pseudazoarcus pumilus]